MILVHKQSPTRGIGRRHAFTLLETLLALGLLLLLMGLGVSTLGSRRQNDLDEGAWRLTAALRMARADAANAGRRLRLTFAENGLRFEMLWEPKPLDDPGHFVAYTQSAWTRHLPSELVYVESCTLVEDQSAGEGASNPTNRRRALDSITFYPDGSSDSAKILLVPAAFDERRRAVIEIHDSTAMITTRLTASDDNP
jgi:type II secretory pathway pseudopilin PulG